MIILVPLHIFKLNGPFRSCTLFFILIRPLPLDIFSISEKPLPSSLIICPSFQLPLFLIVTVFAPACFTTLCKPSFNNRKMFAANISTDNLSLKLPVFTNDNPDHFLRNSLRHTIAGNTKYY
jgi:hypothetical protein